MKEDVFRKEYKELDDTQRQNISVSKDYAAMLYELFCRYGGREAAVAKTKLEEAIMWFTKGVTAPRGDKENHGH